LDHLHCMCLRRSGDVAEIGNHAAVKIDFQRPFTPPSGAHNVLVTRHGAVDPPAPGGLIGGRSDPALNPRGRNQAVALRDRLAGEPICALFTTPLRRTGETASSILERHPVEPVMLPALGELFLGEWEGHGIHDRGSKSDPEFLRVMNEQRWDLIPGAEAQQAFAARVRDGMEAVADAATAGAVAVAVTHGAVIAEICRQATGSEPFAFLMSTNGSITRLVRMPDRRWLLLSFNETDHLRRGV
jgi:2,3-bisphosphoglycerate-dependent phosphoglycerate mutase